MGKERTNWDRVKWTPFEECVLAPDTSPEIAEHHRSHEIRTYRNSIYQVEVRGVRSPPPFGRILWLSFKTLDKQPRHDWREMQRIKNELVGEEFEAVEIYPAESRLVDTSNQYHLWVLIDLDTKDKRLPFGYDERLVSEGSSDGIAKTGKGSRQRDFRSEFRPPDVVRNEDLQRAGAVTTDRIAGNCPVDRSPLVYRGESKLSQYGNTKVLMSRAECLKGKHTFFIADKNEVDAAERSHDAAANEVP